MAGILDSKSRVMDTLITVTGRDQAARGELDVKFASITDRQIYYRTGSDGMLFDLDDRLYFEAASDDNDIIVYESDSDGYLQPFVSDDYSIYGGLAFDMTSSQGTNEIGGNHGSVTFSTGSIDLVSDAVIMGSTNNFKRQYIVGSRNLAKFDKNTPFKLSVNKIDFSISATSPINTQVDSWKKNTDQIDSVFQDHKLGNLLNYRYLPPVTKQYTGALTGSVMANYSKINQDPLDTYEELEEYLAGKPYQEVNFVETSLANNILAQIFSINQTTCTLEKLAIIDVGEYQVDGSYNPHLFFAGKLYRDSVGALTFANIFTIVLE